MIENLSFSSRGLGSTLFALFFSTAVTEYYHMVAASSKCKNQESNRIEEDSISQELE